VITNSKPTSSAILFIIFNRPDTTAQVFNKIREARPPRLYIAADGPRDSRPNEEETCHLAREAVNPIDWPCKVETLYRTQNLGCKEAVSSAIDWFFQHEEEGIILEDDCLPSSEFFTYCDELLERYRHDTRVRHIAGSNFQFGNRRGDASYYFSCLTHIWGWASWRRVWNDYDKNLTTCTPEAVGKALVNCFDEPLIIERWQQITAELKQNKIDTWDYQLVLTNFLKNGLCAIPNANLVTNLGFGPDATHTIDSNERRANLEHERLGPIVHPKHFVTDKAADNFTMEADFRPSEIREAKERQARKYKRLKYRIKRWIARHGGPQRWLNAGS